MKEIYFNEGFDDYISKPIDTNELDRVINRFLGEIVKNNTSISDTVRVSADEQINNNKKNSIKILEDYGVNYMSSLSYISDIDSYIWKKINKFLKRLHPNKSKKWIVSRYFPTPDKQSQIKGKWILTDPISGNQLRKMR